MDAAVLKKDNLIAFLKSLQGVRVIAPVEKNGTTSFELLTDPDAVTLKLDDYTASPKKVLFPQTETLFAFNRERDNLRIAPAEQATETVVFGIRPCDARSFVILDRLFDGDFKDPYYLNKRQQTVLIGLACSDPTNRCFCPSLGGSPAGTEGLDLLFTDSGDSYYIRVITERGQKLLEPAAALLTPPTDEEKNKKDQVEKAAGAKIRRHVNLDEMHERLLRAFESEVWLELANKCLGCGICTYYCPTCHCFDIQDEGDPLAGRRIRVWDACMYEEFTRHTSGANPRHNRAERLRNRILHKFSYYPRNFGYVACVGCGRCIALCPVNEDLIEILDRVRELNG